MHDLELRFLMMKPKIIEAGIKVKSMRDRGEITSEQKSDNSLVTNADKWANTFLTDAIRKDFPGDIVIGEESENKTYPAGSRSVWFVDPIDGTSTYVDGTNEYYVLIGYCENGVPVLGMHYQPETGHLIYGWTGKKPQLLRPKEKPVTLGKISSWKDESRVFIKSQDQDEREQVKKYGVKRATYAKGIVDMIAPLFGKSEGYISFRNTAYWDLVAPAAIMNAAGFRHPSVEHDFLFNDGNFTTAFYYSLPPDTPDEFIQHIRNVNKSRLF